MNKITSGIILFSVFVIISNLSAAYAQSASDASNDTDLGIPSDDPLASVGLADNSTDAGNQSSTAVPEFGSIAPVILAVSVISIVLVSARARIGFHL